MKFPSFDGNRVQEWLFKCERFFELDDTPAGMRVSTTSVEYADAMVTRFGPVEWFFVYIDSFVSLVSQIKLSDEDQVIMFVEGLKIDNKKLITFLSPNNLQQSIAFAKALTSEEDPFRGKGQVNDQFVSSA